MNKKIVSFLAAAAIMGSGAAVQGTSVFTSTDTAIVASADEAKFSDGVVTVKGDYAASAKAVRIYWEKYEGADGFRVYRWTSKGWTGLGNVGADTRTFYEGNLESGTAYKYLVRAFKKTSKGTEWTKVAGEKWTVTKPANITYTAPSQTFDSVTLKWNVSKSNGYEVYKREHGVETAWTYVGSTNHMNKNSYTVSELKSGTQYDFVVRAFRTDPNGITMKVPQVIKALDKIDLEATFMGTIYDFYATLDMQSTPGDLQADMMLSMNPKRKEYSYVGQLRSNDMKVGQLARNEWVSRGGFDITFEGEGFDPKTMNAVAEGKLKHLVFKGNRLSGDANLNVDVAEGVAKADLLLDDPLAALNAHGEVEWRPNGPATRRLSSMLMSMAVILICVKTVLSLGSLSAMCHLTPQRAAVVSTTPLLRLANRTTGKL